MRPDIDEWALSIAELVSHRSKDPNRKIGAVILRPDHTICSTGYNGFARGLNDDKEIYNDKERKRLRIIHAELNAILTARERVDGYTIYIYGLPPCSQCSAAIIQSGIKKVVVKTDGRPAPAWQVSFEESQGMFLESNIEFVIQNEI